MGWSTASRGRRRPSSPPKTEPTRPQPTWSHHRAAAAIFRGNTSRPGTPAAGGTLKDSGQIEREHHTARRTAGPRRFTRRDLAVLGVLLGIPILLDLAIVWGPTLASVVLSFTSWDGIGDLLGRHEELQDPLHRLSAVLAGGPPQSALAGLPRAGRHPVRAAAGRTDRQGRTVQPLLPVHPLHAGGALARRRRLHRPAGLLPRPGRAQRDPRGHRESHRLARRSDLNIWMVLLAAAWRHTGYVMILYLAGLKAVDPSLRKPPPSTAPVRRRPSSASSSRPCGPSMSSSASSPSSRRCAPSTSSTPSTRAETAWSCSPSSSPTTSSARPAGSDSAPPSPSSCCSSPWDSS